MLENYKLLPSLLMRTPLLPINTIDSTEPINFKLKTNYKLKTVQEALYLASPDLYHILINWLKENRDLKGYDQQRFEESLLKYLTRMSTRCTPFGLFAGYNLCKWDKSTSLILDPENNRRSIRFDMVLISHMTNLISKNEIIKHQLKYFPNSSLHEHYGNYRYFETVSSSSSFTYHLSEIDKNSYIKKLIFLATNGLKIDDLCEQIIDINVKYEDAKILILELIENQILVNELVPVISGEPYLQVLLTILKRIREELGKLPSEVESIFEIINDADSFFSISDSNSSVNIVNYEDILRQIKNLIPEVDQKFIFQVDLVTKYLSNNVCNKLAGQIRQAVETLNIIFKPKNNDRLNTFKQEFYKRYEHEEVSLLKVLDNESGIGYPISDEEGDIMPIIDDIVTNHNTFISTEVEINRWLQKKYLSAITEGQMEVNLLDDELKELNEILNNKQGQKYPDIISVMGSIIKNQKDQSEKILLKVVGLSTSVLLGRFTHSDTEIEKYVQFITNHEQELNKGKILAEIVHLPQARIGNVIIRSHLSDYEIPFLAKSTLPEDKIIKISDLYISMSNDLSKIILKSKRLKKEILPRLSSAHNYDNGDQLPLYRFLCDLQNQNCANPVSFNWYQTGIIYPLKPRVVYKNVILQRAGWVFASKDLSNLKLIIKGGVDEIRKWREHWKIPSKVVLVEGDNELFLDLDNPIFLSLFEKMVGKSKQIELLEFLFQPDNCLVKDKEGRMYSNEFIMTFAKETENPYHEGNETEITNINSYKTKRVFSIGSEWIFFKIYLGFKTADEILFAFRKIIYKFKQKGIITQWFFIRFNDPKYHLRIRIHIQHKDSIGMILSEVYKTFNPKIKTGKIANIQIDTYRREIERYGADTIDLVEKYFELQSEIIIDFLKVTMNDSEQDMLKFLFAIKFLDIILTDFGINLENRKKFVDNSLKSFENEFQIHSVSKKQITKKYLFFEPLIISIFENTPNELNNWHLLNDLITKHSNLRVALINEIKMKSIKYKNNATRDSLIWSLNHMFINKLARSKFRKFEYIVYAIFEKYLNKLYHKTGIIKTII